MTKRRRGTPESGSGKGRKEKTGITNVYPASGPMKPKGKARLQPIGTWGQAGRGPEGYFDSGDSEIIPAKRPARAEKPQKKARSR